MLARPGGRLTDARQKAADAAENLEWGTRRSGIQSLAAGWAHTYGRERERREKITGQEGLLVQDEGLKSALATARRHGKTRRPNEKED